MAESIKPRIDASRLTLVQEDIPYEYRADDAIFPSRAILRRRNLLTGDEEIVGQDILRCGEHSQQIKKLATDGKELYLLFDDSGITEQIGKVVKVKGKYRIQFIWLNPNWGPRIKVKDLTLEGGRIYAMGISWPLEISELFDLAGFEATPRDRPCHLDW